MTHFKMAINGNASQISPKTHPSRSPLMTLTLRVAQMLILSSQLAYAGQDGGGERSFNSQRTIAGTQRIRIEGILSCNTTSENNTANGPCTLRIKDQQTGRSYRLIENTESAMKFFQKGQTQVAIEGQVNDGLTVSVKNTYAL